MNEQQLQEFATFLQKTAVGVNVTSNESFIRACKAWKLPSILDKKPPKAIMARSSKIIGVVKSETIFQAIYNLQSATPESEEQTQKNMETRHCLYQVLRVLTETSEEFCGLMVDANVPKLIAIDLAQLQTAYQTNKVL